jgi:acetolactate synthase-1/2/3 large subunit
MSVPQIVYLGGGALDSASEVREFISRTGIPVAQTLMGLGTFPVDDPLSLQMLGMHGTVYANYAVDQVRPAEGGWGARCLMLPVC